MQNKETKAYLGALLYALIVGFSFLFSKIAMIHTSSVLDFLANRFFIAFIFILGYIVIFKKKLDYKNKGIIRLIPLAIASPMLFSAMQAYGLKYSSSSEAGIILATIPIFTMILASYYLGEKTNRLQKISIIFSVSGVIFIMLNKGNIEMESMKGFVFLLISSLSFSVYSVIGRKMTREYTNTELSLVMMSVSFIFFGTLAFINALRTGDIGRLITPYYNRQFIISILYLGVLSTLGTSALTNYVLSKIEASKMVVFSNLGTVISIIAGYVFLGEKIYYYHIVGSVMIILGIIGTNYFGDKSNLKG